MKTLISRISSLIRRKGIRRALQHAMFWALNWCRYQRDRISGCVKFKFSDGVAYRILLPLSRTDLIQRSIARTGRPYEEAELEYIGKRVKNRAVAVDVGANIGNHTLYLSQKLRFHHVYAFEPVPTTYEQLRHNIALNGLEQEVTTERLALGMSDGRATITEFDKTNIGGTRISADSSGDIRVTTLDQYGLNVWKELDFIKIDVEGFEENVVRGGLQTLEKFKPWLFIECNEPLQEKAIAMLLKSIGYDEPVKVAGTNRFFQHSTKRSV